jgi:hypothetical protein
MLDADLARMLNDVRTVHSPAARAWQATRVLALGPELRAIRREAVRQLRARGNSWSTPVDLGIVRAVKVLLDAGIECFESCEGGEGHAFTEPTVRFHGEIGDGWRALASCQDYDLPVLELRRYWAISGHGEPCGPEWEIVFRRPV